MALIQYSIPLLSGASLSGTLYLPGAMNKVGDGYIDGLVIFLHGWGADGSDLAPLSEVLSAALPDAQKQTAFFTPDAPDICSANPTGRQWFELSFDEEGRQKHPLLCWESTSVIHQMVDRLCMDLKIAPHQTILGGFSQGGMLSLAAGPSYQMRLAGVFSLSGAYLTSIQQQELQDAGKGQLDAEFPILLIHGSEDQVVPPHALDHATRALIDLGASPDVYMVSGLGHGIDSQVISHLGDFLTASLLKP